MPTTFIKSSNSTGAGQVLGYTGTTDQDVVVKKLIIGNPVNSGNIAIYGITNPQPSFSTNNDAQLAFKFTYEASVGSSSTRVIDFTSNGGQTGGQSENTSNQGLYLQNGGNVMIDQNMQVTVIWDAAGSEVV